MSQLYVPDKVWLVCSDGMKKSQLKVSSQNTIKIADGRYAATINDRFEGNFMCAKMVIAGAIAGAIIAAAVVASGGTILGLGAAVGGAVAAAGGAAVGGLAAMVPSICSLFCMGSQWQPVHTKVLLQKQQALIEHSKINCFLGGNIMIFYSEAAAEEFTDLVMQNTFVKVGGIILGSALACGAVASVMAGGSAFLANAKLVFGTFGKTAGFIYIGEGLAWLSAGWLASGMADAAKGDGTLELNVPFTDINIINQKVLPSGGYQLVQDHLGFNMQDYADGKTVESVDSMTESNPVTIPNFGSTDPYADASSIMYDDNGNTRNYDPNISQYEELEYERRTVITGRGGGEEVEFDQVSDNLDPRARQELSPTRTVTNNHEAFGDRTGAYYSDETYTHTQGQQLHGNSTTSMKTKGVATLKNALPSLLEWGIDAYNIAMNAILQVPIAEYKESLKQEKEAKKGITVIENTQ